MSTIPFDVQYFVEKSRNNKYSWLLCGLGLIALAGYGALFNFIPRFLRARRSTYPRVSGVYFGCVVAPWRLFNSFFALHIPLLGTINIQPSLLLLAVVYLSINGVFCWVETKDIDYEPQYYIVGKRIGKVATGNFPLLYLFILKNDVLTYITGLPYDKICFLHRWMGRTIWLMIVAHLSLTIYYWLSMDFKIMLKIPPEIFGMIAFGSMTIVCWTSMRVFRRLSYDFFLVNHAIFASIMMIFGVFHNPGGRVSLLLSIHVMVADRVFSRVRSVIHKRVSPSKCTSEFRILDAERIEVVIPTRTVTVKGFWRCIVPHVGQWKAGQHIYLKVGKVRKFQWHPFTIASIHESGSMHLVIRKHNGFTRQLYEMLADQGGDEENAHMTSVEMKTSVYGPYGATYQPLTTFDSVVFIAGGTGASFTFPVALDLARTIAQRNKDGDFVYRPRQAHARFIWYVQCECNTDWYRQALNELREHAEHISIEIYVTRGGPLGDDSSTTSSGSARQPLYSGEKYVAADRCRPEISSGRPGLQQLLGPAVARLQPGAAGKSMAVLACGPTGLTQSVQETCQAYRWGRDAPEIYSYIEKYSE